MLAVHIHLIRGIYTARVQIMLYNYTETIVTLLSLLPYNQKLCG